MRFVFLDKITHLKKMKYINGLKIISFEETFLESPNYPDGIFPPTLIVESLMQLFGFLIYYSTDFTSHPIFDEISEIKILNSIGMGNKISTHCILNNISHDNANFNAIAKTNQHTLLEIKNCNAKLHPLDVVNIEKIKAEFNTRTISAKIF